MDELKLKSRLVFTDIGYLCVKNKSVRLHTGLRDAAGKNGPVSNK